MHCSQIGSQVGLRPGPQLGGLHLSHLSILMPAVGLARRRRNCQLLLGSSQVMAPAATSVQLFVRARARARARRYLV